MILCRGLFSAAARGRAALYRTVLDQAAACRAAVCPTTLARAVLLVPVPVFPRKKYRNSRTEAELTGQLYGSGISLH